MFLAVLRVCLPSLLVIQYRYRTGTYVVRFVLRLAYTAIPRTYRTYWYLLYGYSMIQPFYLLFLGCLLLLYHLPVYTYSTVRTYRFVVCVYR